MNATVIEVLNVPYWRLWSRNSSELRTKYLDQTNDQWINERRLTDVGICATVPTHSNKIREIKNAELTTQYSWAITKIEATKTAPILFTEYLTIHTKDLRSRWHVTDRQHHINLLLMKNISLLPYFWFVAKVVMTYRYIINLKRNTCWCASCVDREMSK